MNSAAAPGEFELIARYFDWPCTDPAVSVGVGDDAALLQADGGLAIAVDTLVAGVHFPESLPADQLGARALAVNLSDMAAVGASPRWFTLALTLPHADAAWLECFSAGLKRCAAEFDVALIGGDTTRGPLTITIQIIGQVPPDQALRRDGAAAGDLIFVTGSPGDAAAGLALMQGADADDESFAALRERFAVPEPRVRCGEALRSIASAALDVSDGLLADLSRLCKASGCGADVDVAALPLSDALVRYAGVDAARQFALTGGDDYELCFTVPPDGIAALHAALREAGTAYTQIGQCTESAAVECQLHGAPFAVSGSGYEHF